MNNQRPTMPVFPFGRMQTPRPTVRPQQPVAPTVVVEEVVVPTPVIEVPIHEAAPPAVESEVTEIQDVEPAEPALTEAELSATEAEKKCLHDESEAKRKADFDAKQAALRETEAKVLAKWEAMSDDEVGATASTKVAADTERLTHRTMKIQITEHIQHMCMTDAAFARLIGHPRKNMANCFKYIFRLAKEYLIEEAKLNDEKSSGGIGGDVPDDLCFRWAEDYFADLKAKEDNVGEEKFVPKAFHSTSGKAKPPAKKKEPKAKNEKKTEPKVDDGQIAMFGEAA
jgi:hypothetical protein